jgi:uncharacterized Zn-binding protein involved in type VI secretion
MAKLLVVEGDKVDGTDKHNVSGTLPNGVTATGTGDYAYQGAVTTSLSDFVTVGGKPLAAVTSGSTLRADGTAAHTASAPKTGSLVPTNLTLLTFAPPPPELGTGKPATGAGSTLLTVDGAAALLAGDTFDTCGVPTGMGSSTVAASGQSFVTCSA